MENHKNQVETTDNLSVGQASRLSNQNLRIPERYWRRHLPHFQLSSGYYFITFTANNNQSLSPSQKDCVFNTLSFLDRKKYELLAAVVMNDHVHIVINPFDALSKIMHSIKSFTAHQINKEENRKGKVWQSENFDRVIRNKKEFLEKVNYIANNPIKKYSVMGYKDYKWLYVKGWINNEATGETPVLP
jgi:REP element-mobilizing transposase RayT